MRKNIVLVFSCVFTLFLATVAQAASFSGNACYEEGANCQTEDEWKAGWCIAAVEEGALSGSIQQCQETLGVASLSQYTQQRQNSSSFSGNVCYEEGANCQTEDEWKAGWCVAAVEEGALSGSIQQCQETLGVAPLSQYTQQRQNSSSSASSSRQSSGGGQGRVANQPTLTRISNPTITERKKDGSSEQASGWVRCQSWRVHRDNPGEQICVNPAPSGPLPKDYSEKPTGTRP
ncbi:MAG: hypothetical protein OXE46_07390 [Chloroflexi bacterium]|nr:hypothetical protein [Chloroflexota bacterium]